MSHAMNNTMHTFLRGRRSLLSLLIAGSLALAGTMSAHLDDNDDNGTLFGVSLPQVNDSNVGYLQIVKGYEKTDVSRMAQLLALVSTSMMDQFNDFLGKVFMQLDLGDEYRGQFFTPWDVSRMMAQISLGDVDTIFRDKPFITLAEPACGAGCMVLAYADVLNQAGYLSHHHMWVSATDIDPLAAGMDYIQLSLCSVAGEVVICNSLHNERPRILYTPGHYLGNWPARLEKKQIA